jgi:hypothetical protein
MNMLMVERYVNDRSANLRAEAARERLVREARRGRRRWSIGR